MKNFLPLTLLIGVFALVFTIIPVSPVQSTTPAIKRLMGENFQNIQLILASLITSDYQNLPEKIQLIHDHAVDLAKTTPSFVKTDFTKRMFNNYAYGLEYQTRNLLTVLKVLVDHDKKQTQSGKLNIDYLRVVAARQFGDIVTSCVLCHNQFRRNIVRQ